MYSEVHPTGNIATRCFHKYRMMCVSCLIFSRILITSMGAALLEFKERSCCTSEVHPTGSIATGCFHMYKVMCVCAYKHLCDC